MDDDIRKQAEYLKAYIASVLAKKPKESFLEQERRLTLEALRKIPWERDARGLVYRYRLDGVEYEDRWDGESLSIDRSFTLPGHIQTVTLDIKTD